MISVVTTELAKTYQVPAPDAIMTTEQVAAWLQVHPRQVQRLRVPALKLSHKTVRYRARDVLAWLQKSKAPIPTAHNLPLRRLSPNGSARTQEAPLDSLDSLACRL